MVKRRIKMVAILVTVILVALGFRIYQIQIVKGEEYAEMAKGQQQIAIGGIDERGIIYDRNGIPLTGRESEYVYILKKSLIDKEGEHLLKRLNGKERKTSNKKYRIFSTEKYHKAETILLQKKYKAYVVKTAKRYSDDQMAVYLLGYIKKADGAGVSGLEKAFDGWLSKRDKAVFALADARNFILPGYEIQNTRERQCGLITTIDSELQKSAETILEKTRVGKRACIIITKVNSAEILTCAVSPGFNPNNVENFLNSKEEELLNIAMQGQYPPGSVFKIVVAAAALEAGICDETTKFSCDGCEEWKGLEVKCLGGGENGHGQIGMDQAFAQSCNSAFIQMGQKVSGEKILEMAKRLGLGAKVVAGLQMEETGVLPAEKDTTGAGIANLSIGQGEILVTPVQIARVMQVVASGGTTRDLTLVRETVENGSHTSLGMAEERRVLSEETAKKLQKMMLDTAKSGTASQLLSEISCGGKTGSAQAMKNGKETVHAWFTGFYPGENPRYAITVFVEDGKSGSRAAVPIFREIVEKLKKTE